MRVPYLASARSHSWLQPTPPNDSPEPVKSLLTCPKCKLEMRLLGIETESATRELYTFECPKCGALEARGVKAK